MLAVALLSLPLVVAAGTTTQAAAPAETTQAAEVPDLRSEWHYKSTFIRYRYCGLRGAEGVPNEWTAYQCRPVDVGGVTQFELWVCYEKECRARARP
ncbi:hypothetical protein ACH4D5_24595 [Streptomyces sp. NPDC018029]|uniref:hypothetical protein n=1 Tax=Streptomyces sp. NPDC018029 TaxID=3365032 RepID=UPI0037A5C1AB